MKNLNKKFHAADLGSSGASGGDAEALACDLKQPFVRISKRESTTLGFKAFVISACLILALLTGHYCSLRLARTRSKPIRQFLPALSVPQLLSARQLLFGSRSW